MCKILTKDNFTGSVITLASFPVSTVSGFREKQWRPHGNEAIIAEDQHINIVLIPATLPVSLTSILEPFVSLSRSRINPASNSVEQIKPQEEALYW